MLGTDIFVDDSLTGTETMPSIYGNITTTPSDFGRGTTLSVPVSEAGVFTGIEIRLSSLRTTRGAGGTTAAGSIHSAVD